MPSWLKPVYHQRLHSPVTPRHSSTFSPPPIVSSLASIEQALLVYHDLRELFVDYSRTSSTQKRQ